MCLTKLKKSTKLGSPSWPKLPHYSYRIFIIGDSIKKSEKTNSLLNLIKFQVNIDQIHLYTKDPSEPNYQLLRNNCEKVDMKYSNDPKASNEYSNDIKDIYTNIND